MARQPQFISSLSWIIFWSKGPAGVHPFSFGPVCLGNVEDAAASWDPHVILYELWTLKVSFFLDFFSPSDFWLFPFSFVPLPPWVPYVILYVQKTFFSWSFIPPNFGLLSFSFDLKPHLKRWDRCCKMGPTCHPLCKIKVSFLGLFFTLWFLAISFFFRSPAAWKRWGCCCLMAPTCHPLWTIKVSFLRFFSPSAFWLFPFHLIPCRLGNVEDAAASWDPHVILYVQ